MKAIGYVRVSTEEQADHGISIDAQIARIESYAQLYGLELVAICRDEGVSGSTLDRPGLNRALEGLQRNEAEALVVAKLDRLTRNLSHLLKLIEVWFGTRHWTLLSVAEHLDPRTASGRLVINMLGVIAQWELETIGERTREAMRHKRERGEYTGGGTPYGFKLVDARRVPDDSPRGFHHEGGRLVRDPTEQRVVEVIHSCHAMGISLRRTAASLTESGYRTRSGKEWTATQVKRVLNGQRPVPGEEGCDA